MIPIRLSSPPDAVLRVHQLGCDGVPLLFLHGLGCASSCDYPAVAAAPPLAGRRMLLVDLLGSGFSDRPTSFAYTVEAHATAVCEVVTRLGLATLDLYGHSLGGAIAIVAATKLGPRLRSLVLSEPNLDPGGGIFSRAIAAQSEDQYVASGHAELVRRETAEGKLVWSGALALSLPQAVHRASVSLVHGASPSWRELLLSQSLPRTVIFGARSLPDPDHSSLPTQGVRVAVVPEAGHSMAWENPHGLAAALAAASGP